MKDSDNLERFIECIHYIGRMMKRNDRDQTLPYGLTKTQWFILRHLRRKPSTIGELATKLEVRPSSMSQMIDRLELAGTVERQNDPSDARSKIVVLSEEGKKNMDKISSSRIELLSAPFAQLSEEEQVKIVELMEKYKANLSATFDHEASRGDKREKR